MFRHPFCQLPAHIQRYINLPTLNLVTCLQYKLCETLLIISVIARASSPAKELPPPSALLSPLRR